MTTPETALLFRLEQTIRRKLLFHQNDTVIVAVSGGADSTALLDLLSKLPGFGLRLIAAHLNHRLRGSDSDADEDFCRQLAARYMIPFESRRVDVKGLAESGQLNLEDAGRRARIVFLDKIREKYDAAAVALAHHSDDQAETVLMRLLRGSGMTGLSGIAYRNARGYVRPLLEISRPEIVQYLRGCGLEWREDASNRDKAYLRNRIRLELLPLLEQYNPAIRSGLAATASILGDEDALLVELTEKACDDACRTAGGEIVCNIGQLQALNPALRRRVFRHAFRQLAGSLDGVGQRHIDAIGDMINSARPNSRLALPQGISAVCEYERMVFRHTAGTSFDAAPDLLITAPGSYQFPTGGSLLIEVSEFPADFRSLPADTACFNLEKTPFPWQARTFRPGDRIMPFGMKGNKKVKDIFIDRKVPLSKRARIPLLFCGADLIWIAGVCSSELCRTDNPSAAMVRVRWQE